MEEGCVLVLKGWTDSHNLSTFLLPIYASR